MKNMIFILSAIFLILTGCLPSEPTTQPSIGQTITPELSTFTATVSKTIAPTIIEMKTPAPGGLDCSNAIIGLPEIINGSIILGNISFSAENKLNIEQEVFGSEYIFAPKKNVKNDLPSTLDQDYVSQAFSVSPDGQWLAALYTFTKQNEILGNNKKLRIITSDGVEVVRYRRDDWSTIQQWVNGNRLLGVKHLGVPPLPVELINPFNGKVEKVIIADYPEILTGLSRGIYTWESSSLSETVYSPDLRYVIYPESEIKLVLWDVIKEKVVTYINNNFPTIGQPVWLSSSVGFLVGLDISKPNKGGIQEELYEVSIDGSLTKLTNLFELGYQEVDIKRISVSHDDRFIAMLFYYSEGKRLAIIDTQTQQITSYCSIEKMLTFNPVWSPVDNQLLVYGSIDSEENFGTMLIDIEKNSIGMLETGVYPIGWMVDPY